MMPALPANIFFIGAAPITIALIAQYGFELLPCEMCHWQRWPYFALMALGVGAWAKPQAKRVYITLTFCLLALAAGLALLHVGVEEGWWTGPTACSSIGTASNLEELRAQVLNSPILRCDVPAIRILGLTMAGGNFLYALAASVLCAILWLRSRKPSHEINR